MTDITVDTALDAVDATDGVTSLREGLVLANADSDASTVRFDAALSGMTISLDGGELELSGTVTIDGDIDGDGVADITVDGNGASRVFHATDGAAILDALTVTGGDAVSGGGLSVAQGASVTVIGSTFEGNSAELGGGAIENFGTVTVVGSTIANNSADTGGGLFSTGAATLVNTTFAGNEAEMGGGIATFGTATVTNATLTGNEAGRGGGIASFGTATVADSVVLGNGGGETFGRIDATGSLVSGDAASVFAVTKDGAGVLSDNGGAVETVALLDDAFNPALNAGDAGADVDGRGFLRIDAADLGAFELNGRDPNAPFLSDVELTAATDTGLSDSDGITANRRPGITFTAGEGDALEIDWNDGNGFRAVGTGTGSAQSFNKPETYLPDAEGAVAIVVRSIKSGQVETATLDIVIDTTAPDVATPVLDAASDTGLADEDGITSDTMLTVTGTGEAFAAVEVLDGDAGVGTTTADDTGAWSLLTAALSEGEHELTARHTDIAGNNGVSGALTVTVDTAAPDAPVITGFSDDTGVTDDGVTADTTPTLTGTAEAGTTVIAFDGETEIGTATADDTGTWTLTTAPLADGAYELTARSVDAAGNRSAFGALAIEIDTSAPDAPVIDGFAEDTGVAGDGITSATILTLTGTSLPDATIEIFDGETSLGTAMADDTGAWSLTTPTLAEGTHALTARLPDAAGNVAVSAVLPVEIDTTAPDAPGIGGLTDPVAEDGGTTPTAIQTLTGTGEPGGTVEILDGDTSLGTATVGDDGKWTFTTPSLADGDHTLTARVGDASGNVSPPIDAGSFTVDTTGPTVTSSIPAAGASTALADAPVMLTFDEPVTLGAGNIVVSNADGSDTRTIDVTDDAVTLSDDGLTLTVDLGADLADGTGYTVRIDAGIALDAVGNLSPAIGDGIGFSTRPTEGGSLIVTTAEDTVDRFDGLTSLREAVAFANSDEDASVIGFDAALDGATVTLGGSQLVLSTDVTIDGDVDGDEAADITIDADGASRVFAVVDGTAQLDSLILTGGDAGRSVGGAVLVAFDASASVTNSLVSNSTARLGGGIQNDGTLTVTGSLIEGNDARLGGGIHNDGTATLTGTTVANNGARVGGGLSNAGDMTVTGSTVSGNTARSDGGVSNEGDLALTNAIVLGNSASIDAEIGTDPLGSTTLLSSVVSGDSAGVFAAIDTAGGGVLADNGGPVRSIALLADFANPALDIGAPVDAADAARGIDLDSIDNGGTIDAGTQELAAADAPRILIGTENRDLLRGAATGDLLRGLEDADVLIGGAGADSLDGGEGSDRIDYADSAVAVTIDLAAGTGRGGTAEGDRIVNVEGVRGSSHDDIITGDASNNGLSGRAGDDTLLGGDGMDVLLGGAGADLMDGGAGVDRVDFRFAAQGVTVDLIEGTSSDDDTIRNVERISGSRHDDTLSGDDGVNDIQGGRGDDSIAGRGGDDVLLGNDGADTLDGGEGTDRLRGGTGDDSLHGGDGEDFLSGEDGDDALDGGAGIDFLSGDAGNDVLLGGAGNDQIQGGDGADSLDGGSENDFLSGDAGNDTLLGGTGSDQLRGGDGADSLDGGAGSDRIDYVLSTIGVTVDLAAGTASDGDTITGVENVLGSSFDDVLTGDGGRNVLTGGEGADRLEGGIANDRLRGDAGADSFVFGDDGSTDLVFDFEDGTDLLVIETTDALTFDDLSVRSNGTATIVGFGTSRIVLGEHDMATLDETDVQFVTL